MNNTFLNKVAAERKVLAVVNKKTPMANQLAGLSRAAIHQWRSKVGFEQNSDFFLEILKIAELCQSLSDRSHETFLPIEASMGANIERHIEKLRINLEKL